MSADAPRRRVALPVVTQWPRVGKIRLGETKDTGRVRDRTGEAITRPVAVDYFRVDGTDGVTSPEAAASFHELYGERPTALRCQLPGRRIEEVWEGAYRLYGARKLKIRCDGSECDERTATGGWATGPCACKAAGIFGDKGNTKACKLSWTLNVLLPDVVGMGVWQITTGSEISVDRVSGWLQMMERVAGDLLLLEFTLNLVPQDVTPDGKTKTVYVLEPRAVSATPRALLEGGGRAALPQLEAGAPAAPMVPPPDDDEAPWTGEVLDDPEPESSGFAELPDDAPAEPEPEAVRFPAVPEPVPGSPEEELWRNRLEALVQAGFSATEVSAHAKRLAGRAINAWDLVDDGTFRAVSEELVRVRERRGGKS